MRLKYEFETMELEGETVAVPVGDSAGEFRGVAKLNETALFILNLLKEETNEESIIDAVEKEFEAPRSVIVADVGRVLGEFRERGLLV